MGKIEILEIICIRLKTKLLYKQTIIIIIIIIRLQHLIESI